MTCFKTVVALTMIFLSTISWSQPSTGWDFKNWNSSERELFLEECYNFEFENEYRPGKRMTWRSYPRVAMYVYMICENRAREYFDTKTQMGEWNEN